MRWTSVTRIVSRRRIASIGRLDQENVNNPIAEVLLGYLPKVLRALCDHGLSGEATALDMVYRLASLIDAIEGRSDRPAPLRRTH